MLVVFGRFRQESEQILAGVILAVGNLSGHWPEIRMHVKEIHIDGHLYAIPLQVLGLIDFLYNNDFAIRR